MVRYQSHPDPIVTAWTYHGGDGLSFGGISPAGLRDVTDRLARHGHVVLTDSRYWRGANHHIVGVGVGHDDAKFAETGGREGSMAAYYENGEAFGGRWWDDVGPFTSRAYYDRQHPRFYAKTGHDGARAA